MPYYIAYGLTIDSSILLPELRESQSTEAEIQVRIGEVPAALTDPVETSARWQAKKNELLLTIEGVARYWVTEGNHIVVQPEPEADDASIRLFLLGSSMGAILLQRGYLPLHANCVVYQDKAYAFAGRSGIGKSTLAAALASQGCSILTDDVCAIDFAQGLPQVYAAGANIKLWQNSLNKLALDNKDLSAIRPDFEKYLYPVDTENPQHAYPLEKIYFLSQHNRTNFIVEKASGKASMRLLKKNTYREFFAHGMGCGQYNFAHYLQLIGQVDTVRITRPKLGFKLDELVSTVLQDIKRHG